MLFGKRQAGVEWIVVLLGNPGQRFTGTRHNVGFMTGDALERLLDVKIDRIKFKALVRQVKIDGRGVLLMKPQTYMNLSGDAVQQAMAFYKVALDHVIVVSDDISLPVGKLRVRRSGSAGGHNGLKDIIAKCGGERFPRVKIGVGAKPNPEMDMADWVLSTFKNGDAEEIERAVKSAAEAVLSVICEGVDKAMNKFN